MGDAPLEQDGRLLQALTSLAGEVQLAQVLQRIVAAACTMVDARYGALGVVGPDRLLVEFVHEGVDDATVRVIGRLPEGHGVLGLLIDDPKPLRLRDLTAHPAFFGFPADHPPMQPLVQAIEAGPVVFVPLWLQGKPHGTLAIGSRKGTRPFTEEVLQLIQSFATQASVALEYARSQQHLQRLAIHQERERIARDLHEAVVSHLFAISLTLQGATQLAKDPELRDRVETAIDALDDTVHHIRSTVFALATGTPPGAGSEER